MVDEKDGDKMQGDKMHMTMKYFSLLTFDGDHICHVTMEVMTIAMKYNVNWWLRLSCWPPISKYMIMVIVKSGNGSKLSIWGFSCHLPFLMVGYNKRWISMAKTNWGLSRCPSTFHKSVNFYHIRKKMFWFFFGLKVVVCSMMNWIILCMWQCCPYW